MEFFRQEAQRKGTWGGRREGAGLKPRDPVAGKRVQKSITIHPEVHAAITAAQQDGESYSEALERLVRVAVGADA